MSLETDILREIELQTKLGQEAHAFYKGRIKRGASYFEGWKDRSAALAFALRSGEFRAYLDVAALRCIDKLEKRNTRISKRISAAEKEIEKLKEKLNYWQVKSLFEAGDVIYKTSGRGYFIYEKSTGRNIKVLKANEDAFKKLGMFKQADETYKQNKASRPRTPRKDHTT